MFVQGDKILRCENILTSDCCSKFRTARLVLKIDKSRCCMKCHKMSINEENIPHG